MEQNHPIHAFSAGFKGIARRIITDLYILEGVSPNEVLTSMSQPIQVKALWDTGATNSVITKQTAQLLNLTPVGVVTVGHAGGSDQCNSYIVNFYLPNKVGIPLVQVSECANVVGDFGAIIGMDIITLGDFAITNRAGKTLVSFRVPSVQEIDFVQEIRKIKYSKVGRNEPCPCGSQKKFKHCHGHNS